MAGADDIIILDGTTFWYSDPNGDLEAREHEGFFYRDVRHMKADHDLDPLRGRQDFRELLAELGAGP